MQEEKVRRPYFTVLFLLIFFIVMMGGFILFVLTIMGVVIPEAPQIDIKEAVNKALSGIGLYLFGLAATIFVSLILSLIIAKTIEGWIVRFLDRRLIPGIEEEGEPTELLGKEVYETQPGERFEKLARPDWGVTHAGNTLPFAIKASGIGAVIGTLLALIASIVALALKAFGTEFPLIWAILLTFLIAGALVYRGFIPQYERVEWLRQNTLYILFTRTLVNIAAGESAPGIVTGRASDPKRLDTPLSEIRELEVATNPAKILSGFPTNRIWDWFLDFMGSVRGVRTFYIKSRFESHDILLHVPHGGGFRKVMEHLAIESKELADDQQYIRSVARKLEHGEPGDSTWTRESGLSQSQEWTQSRTAHLGESKIINLFQLKYAKQRWDDNGRPINRDGPEDEGGLVSLASRIPGSRGGTEIATSGPKSPPPSFLDKKLEDEIRRLPRLPRR